MSSINEAICANVCVEETHKEVRAECLDAAGGCEYINNITAAFIKWLHDRGSVYADSIANELQNEVRA